MKHTLFILLVILIMSGCGHAPKPFESDENKIEAYLKELLGKNCSATVYIVHPNVCGACSNEFLVKMSEDKSGRPFYLLATGNFKPEHEDAVRLISKKIKFIDGAKIARIGLSSQLPQKIQVKGGKVQSVEIMEL